MISKTTKKTLINWLGLLGLVSFVSYALAVVFAPLSIMALKSIYVACPVPCNCPSFDACRSN